MGVGSLEEDRVLESYNKMKDSLTSRNYLDFRLSGKTYDGHGHSSYIEQAITDGLEFIFSDFQN